jgi:hypothetical protein
VKRPTNISNTTEAISQNVHRHDKWLITQRQNAEKRLSPKQFEWNPINLATSVEGNLTDQL